MRINKYLSECGVCSRREADVLISENRILVDGMPARTGMQIEEGMEVLVDGKPVKKDTDKVYLIFYKPHGIECTSDSRVKMNIIDYLHYPKRITYAGRLDRNSEGLMLMTNDGDMIDAVMRAKNMHEKEYVVTVDRAIPDEVLEAISRGVYLKGLNVTTRPCTVRRTDEKTFSIVLTEGLNREIRRMCEAFHFKVRKLKRVRIMNLSLGKLKEGQYRSLTEEELYELRSRCASDQPGS